MPGTHSAATGIARSARILAHPTRVRILNTLDRIAVHPDGKLSPNDLANLLEEPLGTVSYHVRQLLEESALELVDTAPVRGAVEHFYRATAYGRLLAAPLYVCPQCGESESQPGPCEHHGAKAMVGPTATGAAWAPRDRVGPYVLAR